MENTTTSGSAAFQEGSRVVTQASGGIEDKNEPTQVVEKVSGNQCGTCTLCCKLVHVHEIEKPIGKWCPHCSLGKGVRFTIPGLLNARPGTASGCKVPSE